MLTAQQHPITRFARLTDGYNGSDLVETVRSSARHCWRRLNPQRVREGAGAGSQGTAAQDGNGTIVPSRGAAAQSGIMTEEDMLLGIAEVRGTNTRKFAHDSDRRTHPPFQ